MTNAYSRTKDSSELLLLPGSQAAHVSKSCACAGARRSKTSRSRSCSGTRCSRCSLLFFTLCSVRARSSRSFQIIASQESWELCIDRHPVRHTPNINAVTACDSSLAQAQSGQRIGSKSWKRLHDQREMGTRPNSSQRAKPTQQNSQRRLPRSRINLSWHAPGSR